MTRPITRRTFPTNEGAWRASVEERLVSMWGAVQRLRQAFVRVPLTVTAIEARTTTSTTWVDFWLVNGPVASPQVTVSLWLNVDDPATGAEVQLVDDTTGTVILGPILARASPETRISFDTSGIPAGTWVAWRVQARVTTAGGSVSVRMGSVIGGP